MANGIQRSQFSLGQTQQDLATGRRVHDYADLGSDAVRSISAHSMLSKHNAQMQVTKHVETTLGLYDAHLTGLDNTLTDLRTDMMTAFGNEDGTGLQEAIEGAFGQFRDSFNADEGGVQLFGGASSNSKPFVPKDFDEVLFVPTEDAFENDDNKAVANVGTDHRMTYGITADEAGAGVYEAFRTLREAAPFGKEMTTDQRNAIETALGQLDGGLETLRGVNGENGRKQAKLETLSERAEARSLIFEKIISESEDADLGKVAMDLAEHKASLEASYSVFAKLSSLNLTKFL